ncbi:MAG TPA: acyl-CoA carboxylase subunit epsilon [Streptosporangiaceae bacterium]|nr:acyl-CoA carboxylase subunit epsilon [Streptosporangiaceae bacterium]
MTDPRAGAEPRPVLTVVRGTATPDELAALVVVLASRPHARRARPGPPRSLWSAPGRALRAPLFPGPGAWRASALPG